MPNGSDSALGLTRDAATASDAQPEKPSARAPWQGRYPSNGQANGVRSNGSGLVPGELKAQGDTPTFRDRARTVLPVEYQGREVVFEAHAYEDELGILPGAGPCLPWDITVERGRAAARASAQWLRDG